MMRLDLELKETPMPAVLISFYINIRGVIKQREGYEGKLQEMLAYRVSQRLSF